MKFLLWIDIPVVWGVIPYNLAVSYEHFRRACWLNFLLYPEDGGTGTLRTVRSIKEQTSSNTLTLLPGKTHLQFN
jgi:hypothetical protein